MLNQQVINDACEALNKAKHFLQNGCFVAGTLVHTKEGLRPIENIKIGDYVLSKPESGIGELAYKRVTKTFVHENREVFGLTYGYALNKTAILVTTSEHPFWIPTLRVADPNVKYGGMDIPHGKWVTPAEMFTTKDNYYKGKGEVPMYYLSAFDGKEYPVGQSTPICTATNYKKSIYINKGPEFAVLWSVEGGYFYKREGSGVDFRTVPPQYMQNAVIGLNGVTRNKDKTTWVKGSTEYLTRGYQLKLCTVYNLEVEDYRTYFVGEHGIWVHNTHCK
jgi:Pretoxin HINT domain